MAQVWINGDFVTDGGGIISTSNRAFAYADGFFESIRVINGQPVFLRNHYNRIIDTAKVFQIDIPENYSIEVLSDQIGTVLKKNKVKSSASVRITFYRDSGGKYLPDSNKMGQIIEVKKLRDELFVINDRGLTLDVYPDVRKDVNILSVYKSLNCSLYIMASLYAQKRNLDDALIENTRGTIIEATSANLFLVSNGVLYTPSLEDGCLAGTMRMNIINIALERGIKVYECSLTPQNLLIADELFLTNAINGLKWVSSYRTKRYFNEMAKKMVGWLNELALTSETEIE